MPMRETIGLNESADVQTFGRVRLPGRGCEVSLRIAKATPRATPSVEAREDAAERNDTSWPAVRSLSKLSDFQAVGAATTCREVRGGVHHEHLMKSTS